jgi:tetratricopeptide (TPR) repeat protein
VTVEASNTALSEALLALRAGPSPARHRAVATEYRRLGILDTAFDHLTAATRLDPRDAAAYDARARIWRRWGFPELGMGDATRAVYFAPRSAAAHNTLGTLLAAIGAADDARREFEIAESLEPGAWFARANLRALAALAGK